MTQQHSIRRRFQNLCDRMERRIVARPFTDVDGDKGTWTRLARAPQHRIVHHPIALESWPMRARALRIAFLADLHTGSHSHDVARLERVVDDVTHLQPDVVCLGGDYVNGMLFGRGRVPPTVIASRLSQMRAPLGTFAILGDHDALFGASGIVAPFREAGITMLINAAHQIAFEDTTFHLVGVTPEARQLTPLLTAIPPNAPTLVLAHDPAAFAHLPDRPCLMLCGHTHGGQIQLPFVGPLVNMSDAPLRWTYGHIVEGDRHLYVTSGIGTSGLPLRLGIPPEIALVTVTSRQDGHHPQAHPINEPQRSQVEDPVP